MYADQKNLEEIKKTKKPVIHNLEDNVYAVTDLFHSAGLLAGVNVGIIFTEDSIIFIDSGMTVDSGDYAYTIANEKKKDWKNLFLILTHHHSDHTFGMRAMKDRGAKVIAHRIAGEELQGDDGQYKQFIMDMDGLRREEGDRVYGDVVLSVPDVVVDKDTTINIDGEKIQILVTPGHTSDCICVYHPRTKTLFSGDTVYESRPPAINFGGPEEWRQWVSHLARLEKLDIRTIVPGHGNICGKDVIGSNIVFLKKEIREFKSGPLFALFFISSQTV